MNLNLGGVPDAALPAMRTICRECRVRAPRLFDALLEALVAEGGRRNDAVDGSVELDLDGATVADTSDAINAVLHVAYAVTGYAHREADDVIAAGWIAVACVFLSLREQILATADLEALRAYRLQTSPPPNAA